MSSNSSHAGKPSSDTPWIIGSAFIFGPALAYLLSPYSKKSAHHEHHETHSTDASVSDNHEAETLAVEEPSSGAAPLTDDESTEVSAEELITSAFNAEESSTRSDTNSLGQTGDVEQKSTQMDMTSSEGGGPTNMAIGTAAR